MQPQISIVVPVYDNWWMTARALRELERLRASSGTPFETIVVDNASRDETPRAISEFPWVRYSRRQTNENFAGACNAGARLADAPVVLFLNNDAYPVGDALTPLVAAFGRDEVAIAGGALFFEDGVTQSAGFVVLPNAHWHFLGRNLPPTLSDVVTPRDALGVSGAAMAVRTDWFLDGGGFDETYVNGFEDVDLCMRAREGGRVIAYVPQARFAHYEAASEGRFEREAQNESLFYDRWALKFAAMPRTARGSVGAIAVRAGRDLSPLAVAGLDDLRSALIDFGHPVVDGSVPPWKALDDRFRRSATLSWFSDERVRTGVSVRARDGAPATAETHGAVELRVPWLPCASVRRVARLPVEASLDPECATIVVAGLPAAPAEQKSDVLAAIDELKARDGNLRALIFEELPLETDSAHRVDVACVVHAGPSDASSFGNVLLAQADLPSVAVATDEMRAIFASDVALIAERGDIAASVVRLLTNPNARANYARIGGNDARRRFSPRRSAIRIVDLLCAARFGYERPGKARGNSPLER